VSMCIHTHTHTHRHRVMLDVGDDIVDQICLCLHPHHCARPPRAPANIHRHRHRRQAHALTTHRHHSGTRTFTHTHKADSQKRTPKQHLLPWKYGFMKCEYNTPHTCVEIECMRTCVLPHPPASSGTHIFTHTKQTPTQHILPCLKKLT
jgi:hypothetical protein